MPARRSDGNDHSHDDSHDNSDDDGIHRLRNDPSDERWDFLPDVRDGLTRAQRIVMYELYKAQKETGRDFIPTVMLYGRVVEHLNIDETELQAILRSLGVMGDASRVEK